MTAVTKRIGDTLVFYQGDDREDVIEFSMLDVNGDPVESGFMVGATVVFRIYDTLGETPLLELTSDDDMEIDLDGVNDSAVMYIDAEDISAFEPGDYLYRLHVTLADEFRTTVALNTLTIVDGGS